MSTVRRVNYGQLKPVQISVMYRSKIEIRKFSSDGHAGQLNKRLCEIKTHVLVHFREFLLIAHSQYKIQRV